MIDLLSIVVVFTIVFGVDYLLFLRDKTTYNYVSHETRTLFVSGQIVLILLFWPEFKPFSHNYVTELIFIGIFLVSMLLFAHVLTREKLLVCHTNSRTERCLTPGYVFTKGTEITFQQLAYAAIAFSLVPLFEVTFYAYIAYAAIMLIMHTTVVLSMSSANTKLLTFGVIAISAPVFLIFTELQVLWPAIYLHALLYVFLWLTFADWEGKVIHVSHETY